MYNSYTADGRRSTLVGTIDAATIPGAISGNQYNADNEATSFNGQTLTYDSDGQTLTDTSNIYTWDVRRHLNGFSGFDSASFVGACPERSRRNALGRRISKTVNGVTTKFLGACPERSRRDGLNPVQELNGSGGVVANMLTGLNIDEYFMRTEASCCGPLRYLTDALGSTIAPVHSGGNHPVQLPGTRPLRRRRHHLQRQHHQHLRVHRARGGRNRRRLRPDVLPRLLL